MKVVRRTAAAAALVLAVGAAALLTPWNGGARVAFADVIEQVQAAHVFKCTAEIEIDVAGKNQTSESEIVMSDAGWTETRVSGMTTIMYPKQGKTIMLRPDKMEAVVVTGQPATQPAPQAAGLPDMFADLQKMAEKKSKDLGEKVIDGKKTRGFEATVDASTYDIWADEETQRPVLVTVRFSDVQLPVHVQVSENGGNPALTGAMASMMKGVRLTMRNFQWNPVVEKGVAEGEVPPGYKVVKAAVDTSPATEKDVFGMLEGLAWFRDGVLPQKVGTAGMMEALDSWKTQTGVGKDTPADEQTKIMATVMPKLLKVSRGWMFMADASKGADWTYAGQGIKLGTHGVPVLWYRPAGQSSPAGAWRVIDADGKIHQEMEPPAGGEKVDVSMAAIMQAATRPDAGKPLPVPDQLK